MSGECLGGALWWKDLLQLSEEVGFSPPRLVTAKLITVGNKELQEVLGNAHNPHPDLIGHLPPHGNGYVKTFDLLDYKC